MRFSIRLALSLSVMVCVVAAANVARAGVVLVEGTRSVSVFPEATQSGITPAQGPKVEQAGVGVFGEEIVQEQFLGPSDTSAFGRASQVSIIDETGFDFHGRVTANTTGPHILARSFLGFTFDVDVPTTYFFRFDIDAVPDVDSQNADGSFDVLELLLSRVESGGGFTAIHVEDRTFDELFPEIPSASGTLQPGRYRATVVFDAPVTGVENVDLTYDIGLTLGGNTPPPNPIPLPPAAWAALSTMAIAGAARGLRRLRCGR